MNLFERCVWSAGISPNRLALSYRSDRGEELLSYSDLLSRADQMAANLVRRGLRRGDRVAFFLSNRVENVVAFLAALRLGAVVVPINLAYRGREITHILQDAGPRFLISERERRQAVEQVSRELSVELLFVEDLGEIQDLMNLGEMPRVASEDLALLLYTSGTTGRSKGAMLSHGNILATIRALQEAWGWQASDCLLLTLPLFHTHGLIVGLATALASSARVELRSGFEAGSTLKDLMGGGPSLFFGVPTMYARLLEALEAEPKAPDLSGMRLFCSGSAPLRIDTHRDFEKLTGHSILERYGMTETGMNLSNPLQGSRVPGSVGIPLPGVSIRIVDEQDREVEPGTTGRLLVCGDNVFEGYWRAPEKTAESFVEIGGRRFFRTGDLARAHAESGYITLVGRQGDLIISGGLNIYPKEVEEVLLALPGVREVAVVARPDPEWGESPVAFVVVSELWDENAAKQSCRAEMASFKIPKAFLRLESLPRNALGKVEKHRLREWADADRPLGQR